MRGAHGAGGIALVQVWHSKTREVYELHGWVPGSKVPTDVLRPRQSSHHAWVVALGCEGAIKANPSTCWESPARLRVGSGVAARVPFFVPAQTLISVGHSYFPL